MKKSMIISNIDRQLLILGMTILCLGLLTSGCTWNPGVESIAPTKTSALSIDEPFAESEGRLFDAQLSSPEIISACDPVMIDFTITNTSADPVYLLSWFTPLEGLINNIFLIEHNGEELDYLGPMVMRGDPIPEQYEYFKPGQSKTVSVNLSNGYDFNEPGEYTIGFRSPWTHIAYSKGEFASTSNELNLVPISSNSLKIMILKTESNKGECPDKGGTTTQPEPAEYSQERDTQAYRDEKCGFTVLFPDHWKYPENKTILGYPFQGEDGFFSFSVARTPDSSLTEVEALVFLTQRESNQESLPYGPEPRIEKLTLDGQPARLILPDPSAGPEYQVGTLIVPFPYPIRLITQETSTGHFLLLTADLSHIEPILKSIRFFNPANPPPEGIGSVPPGIGPDMIPYNVFTDQKQGRIQYPYITDDKGNFTLQAGEQISFEWLDFPLDAMFYTIALRTHNEDRLIKIGTDFDNTDGIIINWIAQENLSGSVVGFACDIDGNCIGANWSGEIYIGSLSPSQLCMVKSYSTALVDVYLEPYLASHKVAGLIPRTYAQVYAVSRERWLWIDLTHQEYYSNEFDAITRGFVIKDSLELFGPCESITEYER